MTTSRRGFLKTLTNIALAIQAAPALRAAELVFVAPAAETLAVYTALDFAALLKAHYGPLLVREIMAESPFTKMLARSSKDWQGGSIPIPFTRT